MIRSGTLARFRDAPGFDKLLNAAQTRADAGHTAVSLMANDKAMTRFALSLEHFVKVKKDEIGLTALGKLLGVDAANLAKVIEGKRKPSKALLMKTAAARSQGNDCQDDRRSAHIDSAR